MFSVTSIANDWGDAFFAINVLIFVNPLPYRAERGFFLNRKQTKTPHNLSIGLFLHFFLHYKECAVIAVFFLTPDQTMYDVTVARAFLCIFVLIGAMEGLTGGWPAVMRFFGEFHRKNNYAAIFEIIFSVSYHKTKNIPLLIG